MKNPTCQDAACGERRNVVAVNTQPGQAVGPLLKGQANLLPSMSVEVHAVTQGTQAMIGAREGNYV